MVYVALFLLACACIFAWLALTAPQGWQDRRGFHYGAEHGDFAALSHCLECQCWITGPCNWIRCPFALDGREDDNRPAPGPAPFSHATPNSAEAQPDHVG